MSRKIKIGVEVAHVTRDSDTTFKVKRLKVKGHMGRGILRRPPAHSLLGTCFQSMWDLMSRNHRNRTTKALKTRAVAVGFKNLVFLGFN